MSTAKEYLSRYKEVKGDERITVYTEAEEKLSKSQFKIFKREAKEISQEEDEEDDSGEDSSEEKTPEASASTRKEKGKGPSSEATKESKTEAGVAEIDEATAERFWSALEAMSGVELLSEQVIKDFQYVGFDPNTVMKTIILKGRGAKRSDSQIKSDIAKMCTIAVIKGSVTDNNLKKMSDEGKRSYGEIETLYSLKRGGSKGVDPKVITISRVGAAFPGSMMKILMTRPDLSKKFAGPFGTKILPSYLRHQSAAACIPETLEENAKNFLIGLVIAFTSDQSKTISKSKDNAEELYGRQENFITQTHSSSYPSEAVRKSIFKTWTLVADYDKLSAVGQTLGKIIRAFEVISKEDLKKAYDSV
jgi:Sec-independent protein translocase protein TatA